MPFLGMFLGAMERVLGVLGWSFAGALVSWGCLEGCGRLPLGFQETVWEMFRRCS